MSRGPEPKKPRPSWSKALQSRRIFLDLLQTDVSDRTEDEISQGTISDLERGKTELTNMTMPRLTVLAQALEWSIEEMEAATGLKLQHLPTPTADPPTLSPDLSAAGRGYRIPEPEVIIPDELLNAAELYGGDPEHAGLREYRWQVWMTRAPHKKRPTTPGEWLTFYSKVKDTVDPPEIKN